MKREQFNVRLTASKKNRIAKLRQKLGTTNDTLADIAFEHLFTSVSPAQIERFVRAHRSPYSRALTGPAALECARLDSQRGGGSVTPTTYTVEKGIKKTK